MCYRDVKDRTVLKIYDTEPARSDGSRSPSRSPKSMHSSRTSYMSSGHESDSSVRSAPPGLTNLPRSPVHAPTAQRPFSQDVSMKLPIFFTLLGAIRVGSCLKVHHMQCRDQSHVNCCNISATYCFQCCYIKCIVWLYGN